MNFGVFGTTIELERPSAKKRRKLHFVGQTLKGLRVGKWKRGRQVKHGSLLKQRYTNVGRNDAKGESDAQDRKFCSRRIHNGDPT